MEIAEEISKITENISSIKSLNEEITLKINDTIDQIVLAQQKTQEKNKANTPREDIHQEKKSHKKKKNRKKNT